MVRLKPISISVLVFEGRGLNSTMVRLKPKNIAAWQAAAVLSQFHYGSIKTKNFSFKGRVNKSLNSTMVRLKLKPYAFEPHFDLSLNSTMVRLKLTNVSQILMELLSLNSTMVRLKQFKGALHETTV